MKFSIFIACFGAAAVPAAWANEPDDAIRLQGRVALEAMQYQLGINHQWKRCQLERLKAQAKLDRGRPSVVRSIETRFRSKELLRSSQQFSDNMRP